MSAGEFVVSKYGASYGDGTRVHPIKVQPETIDFAIGSVDNAPPSVAINNPISAVTSLGRRAKGLKPRMISFRLTSGAPATYKPGSVLRIPALTEDIWDVAVDGAACEYLTGTGVVVGRSSEQAR